MFTNNFKLRLENNFEVNANAYCKGGGPSLLSVHEGSAVAPMQEGSKQRISPLWCLGPDFCPLFKSLLHSSFSVSVVPFLYLCVSPSLLPLNFPPCNNSQLPMKQCSLSCLQFLSIFLVMLYLKFKAIFQVKPQQSHMKRKCYLCAV